MRFVTVFVDLLMCTNILRGDNLLAPDQFTFFLTGGSGLLPAAHTCFNQLDLPEYKSEEEMREKLRLALKEGSGGFGFG